jgi:hypothetical protein
MLSHWPRLPVPTRESALYYQWFFKRSQLHFGRHLALGKQKKKTTVINGTENTLSGHNYQNTKSKSQQNQTIRNKITTEYTRINEPTQTHKIRDRTVETMWKLFGRFHQIQGCLSLLPANMSRVLVGNYVFFFSLPPHVGACSRFGA